MLICLHVRSVSFPFSPSAAASLFQPLDGVKRRPSPVPLQQEPTGVRLSHQVTIPVVPAAHRRSCHGPHALTALRTRKVGEASPAPDASATGNALDASPMSAPLTGVLVTDRCRLFVNWTVSRGASWPGQRTSRHTARCLHFTARPRGATTMQTDAHNMGREERRALLEQRRAAVARQLRRLAIELTDLDRQLDEIEQSER